MPRVPMSEIKAQHFRLSCLREATKGRAIKEKKTFLEPFFQRSKISTAIKLKGGGGLGLNGPAIKRRTFFSRLP